MTIAEKLAGIAKRAKSIEDEINELEKFAASIRDKGLGFQHYYFDTEKRFHKTASNELLSIIARELETLNQELEMLADPEYLSELLKEN